MIQNGERIFLEYLINFWMINAAIDVDANCDFTSLTTLPKRVPPVVCTCDADSIALKSVLYRVAFQPPLFILIRCKIRNLQLPQADGEATAEGWTPQRPAYPEHL